MPQVNEVSWCFMGPMFIFMLYLSFIMLCYTIFNGLSSNKILLIFSFNFNFLI